MVFTKALSSKIRNGIVASTTKLYNVNNKVPHQCKTQIRHMAGGGGYLKTSPTHIFWGEAFGVLCWLWIFYRARQDLPVVLGWRHPWEHDSHDDHHHEEHEEH